MKQQSQSETLEYWFTIGMGKGLSFEDAVLYAEKNVKI